MGLTHSSYDDLMMVARTLSQPYVKDFEGIDADLILAWGYEETLTQVARRRLPPTRLEVLGISSEKLRRIKDSYGISHSELLVKNIMDDDSVFLLLQERKIDIQTVQFFIFSGEEISPFIRRVGDESMINLCRTASEENVRKLFHVEVGEEEVCFVTPSQVFEWGYEETTRIADLAAHENVKKLIRHRMLTASQIHDWDSGNLILVAKRAVEHKLMFFVHRGCLSFSLMLEWSDSETEKVAEISRERNVRDSILHGGITFPQILEWHPDHIREYSIPEREIVYEIHTRYREIQTSQQARGFARLHEYRLPTRATLQEIFQKDLGRQVKRPRGLFRRDLDEIDKICQLS